MSKEPAASHNSIALGCNIKGEITVDNDIRIDGKIEGNIDCKGKVIVGPSGEIIGNITCTNAEIMGSLTGNMNVSDTLTIQSTGKVKGDIQTAVLIIQPNAVFSGSCSM